MSANAGGERLAVGSPEDVDRARRRARVLADARGLSRAEAECVSLAASELAANLVRYATSGEIVLTPVDDGARTGVQVESLDRGPGIPDLDEAMRDGYSTGGGLGSGLPGVRRLMDAFEIASTPQGTRIVARKWRR